MKVFFIHEVDYLCKVIYEMHEFPELLAQKGHEIVFFDFPERIKGVFRVNRSLRRDISGRVNKNTKLKLITPFTVSSGIIQRILAFVTTFPSLAINIIQTRPDVLVTYAVPTYGIQLLILSKIFHIPIIYRAIDVSHMIRETKLNPIIRQIEKLLVRKSHTISCHNTAMEAYIKSLGEKINIEINLPPIQLVDFKRDSSIVRNKKEIIFIGTLFPFSGLEKFLKSYKNAGLELEGYTLKIIGGGPQFDVLSDLVKSFELSSSVKMLGFVQYNDLFKHLSTALIAINPFEKKFLTDKALPHKIIQYAASGNLVISTPLEGIVGLFDVADSIFWASDTDEMVSIIRKISIMSDLEKAKHILNQDFVLKSKLDLNMTIINFEQMLVRTSSPRNKV